MSPWLDFYRQIIAYFSPIPAEKISVHYTKTNRANIERNKNNDADHHTASITFPISFIITFSKSILSNKLIINKQKKHCPANSKYFANHFYDKKSRSEKLQNATALPHKPLCQIIDKNLFIAAAMTARHNGRRAISFTRGP